MTYKDFQTGAVFTSADADLLMRQGLIVVSSAAARDAIDTPTEGMQVYRLDTHTIELHTGTGWQPAGVGTYIVGGAAARDAIVRPVEGMQVYRLDTHMTETYSGSAWVPHDSGWITIGSGSAADTGTFGTGWSSTVSSGRRLAAVRRIGKTVRYEGVLVKSSASLSTDVMLTVPAGFAPAMNVDVPVRGGSSLIEARINANGTLALYQSGITSPAIAPLSPEWLID